MTARVRALVGLMTIALLLFFSGTLWASERPIMALVLLGLALFRAVVWFRQVRSPGGARVSDPSPPPGRGPR